MINRQLLTPLPRFYDLVLRRNGHGGIPGSNLPFNINCSRIRLTVMFALFFGSGLSAPFFVLRHQLAKK